ncbi:MAG: hypothetical protein JSW55_06155 [Chloroflexota bacterium]|nr:MAG: hypothetical protein JSW55_06155 [Chloroflexota bacterium]
MIISHKFKYVFVALPRTGTTAVEKELKELYDGQPILKKHSTYHSFLQVASEEEKEYFVLSSIRNPMDDAVSRFFKIKSNHSFRHTRPKSIKRRKGAVERYEDLLFRYVQQSGADFPTFFKLAYRFPYDNWSSLNHQDFDFVIRFEHLPQDFSTALELMAIEQIRPLPVRNTTKMRDRDYLSHYTPEIRGQARRVFGPFMKQWGYEFPPEWGEAEVPWSHQVQYQWAHAVRSVYWKYLRGRI